jgi:hypothetical protein
MCCWVGWAHVGRVKAIAIRENKRQRRELDTRYTSK